MVRNGSKTWALAMNGTRARILRDIGDNDSGSTELVLRAEGLKLREIMADKPSRSFASVGGRRPSMEYGSDPLAEDRRAFVRQVISLLESHRRAGDFDRLVIFAENDALGDLRRLIPQPLRQLVIREVPRNLLRLSARDLLAAITNELGNE